MALDIERLRAETPATQTLKHLNNAGAALMPSPVHDCLVGHLELESEIGGYEASDREIDRVNHFYKAAADLINAEPSEIGYIENATRAWDMVFYGLPLKPGDRILTAGVEYGSNLVAYTQRTKQTGAVLDIIPSTATGEVDVEALENMIDDRVKLVSITHIPTNGGLINPAEEIGAVCRKHNIPYLLDACQSLGQIPVDVEKLGCDMLSGTGRKFLRGPRGTGLLYVRKSFLDRIDPPFLDQHSAAFAPDDSLVMLPDSRRFENWEYYVAGKIALGVAMDYARDLDVSETSKRVIALAAQMREGLAKIPGVHVKDLGSKKGGIITFFHENVSAETIKKALLKHQINVSLSDGIGAHLDVRERKLPTMIRASTHYYNTEAEVDALLAVVRELG